MFKLLDMGKRIDLIFKAFKARHASPEEKKEKALAAPTEEEKKPTPKKEWKWILIDSVIIGVIALCASMPSATPTETELWIMFKAFLAAFILQLAIERGLKRK